MTQDEKLNSLTRLLILIVLIMIVMRNKYWLHTLFIGLIIIILLKYFNQSSKNQNSGVIPNEGFRDIEAMLENIDGSPQKLSTTRIYSPNLVASPETGQPMCVANNYKAYDRCGIPTEGLNSGVNEPVPRKTGNPYFPQSDGFSSYVYGSNQVAFGPDDTLWAGKTAGLTGDGRDRFPYRMASGRSHPCNPSPAIEECGTCSQTTLTADSLSLATDSELDRGKYIQPNHTPAIGRSYWRMKGPQTYSVLDQEMCKLNLEGVSSCNLGLDSFYNSNSQWKVTPPLSHTKDGSDLTSFQITEATNVASPFTGETEYGDIYKHSIRGYPSLLGKPLNSVTYADGQTEGFEPPSEEECCSSAEAKPALNVDCIGSRSLDWRKYRNPVTGINPPLRYAADVRPGQNIGDYDMRPATTSCVNGFTSANTCAATQYRPEEIYNCSRTNLGASLNPLQNVTQQQMLNVLSGTRPATLPTPSCNELSQSLQSVAPVSVTGSNPFSLATQPKPSLIEGFDNVDMDMESLKKKSNNSDLLVMNYPKVYPSDAVVQGNNKLVYDVRPSIFGVGSAPGGCNQCASSEPDQKVFNVAPILSAGDTLVTSDKNAFYNPSGVSPCHSQLPMYRYLTDTGSCVASCKTPTVYPPARGSCGDVGCPGNRFDPYVGQGYDTRNGVQLSYTNTPCNDSDAFSETNDYYRNVSDIRRTTNQGFETRQFQEDPLLQQTRLGSCIGCFPQKENTQKQNACHYITRNNISHIVPPADGGLGGIGASSETALEAQDRYELMRRESLGGGYRSYLSSRRKHACSGMSSNLGFYYT